MSVNEGDPQLFYHVNFEVSHSPCLGRTEENFSMKFSTKKMLHCPRCQPSDTRLVKFAHREFALICVRLFHLLGPKVGQVSQLICALEGPHGRE